MIYTSSSIKEVIGRVIRGTSIQDTDLLGRCDEWIPEAMGYMKTKVTLQNCWKPVPVEFHKGRLPCGLRSIIAVELNGQRVRYYNHRAFNAPGSATAVKQDGLPTLFGTQLVSRGTDQYEDGGGFITETELTQLNDLPFCEAYYFTELDWLNLSLKDACPIVHYRRVPVDKEGFPLIPDNENYKEALYWYCRGKLIGAGWQDRVFSYDHCEARFEKHAGRAMAQIRYPSVDQAQAYVDNADRFIMPDGWANSFFNPLPGEGTI